MNIRHLSDDSVEITCGNCGMFRIDGTSYAAAKSRFSMDSDLMKGLRSYIKAENSKEPPHVPYIGNGWQNDAKAHKKSVWEGLK